MTTEQMREKVHSGIDKHCASLTSDPFLMQRVLHAANEDCIKKGGIHIKKHKIAICVVIAMMMLGTVAFAVVLLLPEFFSEVAHLTLNSGDYVEWTLDEKRYMIQIMNKYGLLDDAQSDNLWHASEDEIDHYMLKRYGAEKYPDDLGWISIDRIAWVEMGPYTDWSNETWVWYSNLMFEVGLWTEKSDVDVYLTPGKEAIKPEKAIEIAMRQLQTNGYSSDELEKTTVFWHYMTHASDVNHESMVYLITVRFPDKSEEYVFMSPDGTLK